MTKNLSLLSALLLSIVCSAQMDFANITVAPALQTGVDSSNNLTELVTIEYQTTGPRVIHVNWRQDPTIFDQFNTPGTQLGDGCIVVNAATTETQTVQVAVNVWDPSALVDGDSDFFYITGMFEGTDCSNFDDFVTNNNTPMPSGLVTYDTRLLSTNDFTAFDSQEIFYNRISQTLEINKNLISSDSLQVFDITGKLVAGIQNTQQTNNISLSDLSKGMYIVRSDKKFLKFIR